MTSWPGIFIYFPHLLGQYARLCAISVNVETLSNHFSFRLLENNKSVCHAEAGSTLNFLTISLYVTTEFSHRKLLALV